MGKKLILVIMLCVFQMGVSLLLFPIWNRLFTEREVMHSAERFLSEAAAPVSEPDTENTDPTEPQKPYAELWEEMCAYNDNLYAQKQADLLNMDQKDKTLMDDAPEEDSPDKEKSRSVER